MCSSSEAWWSFPEGYSSHELQLNWRLLIYSSLPPKKTGLAIKTKITSAKLGVRKARSVWCRGTWGNELSPAQKEKLHTFIRPGRRSAAAAELQFSPRRSGKALIPTTRSKATESVGGADLPGSLMDTAGLICFAYERVVMAGRCGRPLAPSPLSADWPKVAQKFSPSVAV